MTDHHIVSVSQLKPTQLTVGMMQVKHKRKHLRALERRPAELVEFILEHPVRVVHGPAGKSYVIDHHHLALALTKEGFETAPVEVEADFSTYTPKEFWKKMEEMKYVHPFDASGKPRTIADLPKGLKSLKDDPYRSLAGFTREAGGFAKVRAPFAEFQWADYFRVRVKKKLLKSSFKKALRQALALASHADAKHLPGYQPKKVVSIKKSEKWTTAKRH